MYSWDVGLGVNFTSLYAYYLASPVNWLLIFCPQSLVIEFIMFFTVIKIGLCGLSMTFYLRRHFRTQAFGTAFFGIFYALSGYICAYYWNVMWLDCILLFPLILYAMERMLLERRGALYALLLGVSILSNYYISIMTCMFLVLYFIALNVLYAPASLRGFFGRALRFALCSLLAGGIAAVLLLPELWALRATASADSTFPQTFTQYFSIIDMFARQLPGVDTEQALDHWPNIYAGTAVLPLLWLYFTAKRISVKEKAVYGTLLLFFLASFSINVLNFIWHGMHYPNSLPARQSYIYCFLLLTVCCHAYLNRRSFRLRQLSGALFVSFGFILLAQKLVTAKHFHFAVFYAGLLLAALYVLLLYLDRKGQMKKRRLTFLALFLVTAEAAANTALTSITTTSREAYVRDNEDIRALVETRFPSTDFFRMERMNSKTKNDGAWLNFPSASLFSSLADANCTNFFKTLGLEGSTNAYSTNGATPFVRMLFSIRYAIYNAPQTSGDGKTFLESRGNSYLYQNNYTLPLGFILPREMEEDWMLELDNPALVQNALCDQLGVPAVLVPNEELGSQSGASFAATVGADGDYFAVVTNPRVKEVTVSWPDRKKTFENVDRGYLLDLGSCYAGDLIEMQSETEGQDLTVELYRFDYEALEQLYERLAASPLQLSVWEDAALSGTVTVDLSAADYLGKTARLFLSVPYDEGWQATVDGVPAETKKCFDTFLGLDLTAGQHEITLRYRPVGLLAGAAVTGVSLLLLLLLALWERRRTAREEILVPLQEAEAAGAERDEPETEQEDAEQEVAAQEEAERESAEQEDAENVGAERQAQAEQKDGQLLFQVAMPDEPVPPQVGEAEQKFATPQSAPVRPEQVSLESAKPKAAGREKAPVREVDLLAWLEEKEDLPGARSEDHAGSKIDREIAAQPRDEAAADGSKE